MDTIIGRIKKIMDERKIKAAEISRRSGIDRSSISHYLKGDYLPKSTNTEKIADALGVSVAYLHGYTNDPRPLSPQEEIEALLDYYSDPSLPAGLVLDDPAEIDIIKHYRAADDKTKKAVRIMLGVEE